MRICSVDKLKNTDVLAQDVLNEDYRVLFAAGTILTDENIDRLKRNYIKEVYIQPGEFEENVAILKDEIETEFHEKLQSILEKHTYSNSSELSQLNQTADNLISTILTEEPVVEKIYDIKERSANLYEHCITVCSLSTIIALKLGLDEKQVHDIAVACLLHELGIRYLSLAYEGREIQDMDEFEATEYKKHTVYGYSAVQDENWLSNETKNMILYHHERLDGSGYPLKATEIPIACRIIQIVDAFDEMICGIGHRQSKVYEALEYLKIYSGTAFDKSIVDIFMSMVAVYPVGSYVITNEGETAVVLRQNRSFPDRPVIRIIKDKSGNPVKNIIIKDLVKINNVFIEDVD